METHPEVHGVVDFSCYHARAAEDLGTFLAGYRVIWYLYVSTDSVYEVKRSSTKHVGSRLHSSVQR
jgi:hypothetical protein